ncbi:MAG: aldehyde dehydrogenase family protein [Candidatus Marinimicrobia bacterium]|jgi:aldehyde dehydrogenase (NAD+)|nr:aldehyde dehydrogenase family protein [Candidatus Neomarinimicrobiota bacterium]MBT3495956.1 aldehyde dehydrogenase family protein [Candidatus Neomarinimicrobiota bacterium]MBT3692124.1 aldehyde dehydrogenase family protein [Candidatus Neomarinimicrobiota bacterium]MBT3732125.1 aldehyde dehydrogenase family protein [Candidatus Neomarinimicrobiota bacterium]MBT4143808.1 aldehyde dehydrogenase family protein [Candidatus Neomarinimicrobiota bacterium]
MDVSQILSELGIQEKNYGGCSGPNGWSTTKDAGELHSVNPSTGEVIASVYECSVDDYDRIIKASEEAFKAWRKVPAPLRGQLVLKMGNRLREKKDALGSLVSLEMGKIKQEGDGEVQEMIDIADFAVGQSRMLYGKTMHSERQDHRMYEQWHPLGPVGIISAFNFPVAVWSWNSFLAAICGDTSVWKPSSTVPLTAIAIQNICNDVLEEENMPHIFSLIIGKGRSIGEKLINDNRVPLISFTGSTNMGRHVGNQVSQRFGKTILELGGNNAIIVDETANLDLAIPAIAFGAVGTAGQRCTSTRRIIVHESIAEELTSRLVKAYGQVKIGNPLEDGTLMGPLVNESAVQDYEKALEDLKTQGGEILVGGKAVDGSGFFVEPTIAKAENQWDIVQTETFAPILYVMTYKTLDEAIEIHNGVPQGLSSAIFTSNVQNSETFLASIGSDCGIANVNIGTSGAEIGGAFGGEKETGGGRESGSDSWKQYMRRQTNTINWGKELPLAQGIKFDLN